MVLAVPDEPARGRKPVLRDELAAVVVKQQHPPERLRKLQASYGRSGSRSVLRHGPSRSVADPFQDGPSCGQAWLQFFWSH
ncbi:MAG: hypothetical protein JXA30_13210, partial [Deltaproteobacteria bacterium]|nr:hypothetical protein [Deltaproteobacteria bacterium]